MIDCTKRIVFRMLPLLTALAVSCGDAPDAEMQPAVPAGGKMEVCVAAFQDGTRTEIEENGMVTRWSSDDSIALWAMQDGGAVLEAQPFALWHFGEEYPEAWFTAQIDPMPEGRHTYYGAYPVPVSVSGTTAEYDLPAVQDGSNSLRNAVMVARPVEGDALTSEDAGELHLDFVHKLHILKITVPEDKNLLGEPICKLEITFSCPVTGRLTVDVADADAPVALADGGSEVLTLQFPTPIEAGATVYAVIAPVDLTDGTIAFRAYSERLDSESIVVSGRNFQAAHTTPVRLTIPQRRKITRFSFTIGKNRLGEEPQSFTVKFADGTLFPGGESEVSFDVPADADAEGRYEYVYEGYLETDYSGKAFQVVFDSESALVSDEFAFPDSVELYARTTVAPLTVPWLLFENFDGLTGNPSDNDNLGLRDYDATDLSNYGVPGWSISRAAGSAGTCLCLRHYRTYFLKYLNYVSRINSCAISALKQGHSVKVHVSFNAATAESSLNCHVGIFDTAVESYPGTAVEIDNPKTIMIPYDESCGSYAGMSESAPLFEYDVEGVTNTTALAWRTIDCDGGIGYFDTFIDNIRVSIVQ